MTLSNNEILQYMSGYLSYEEVDGYLSFCRFTKKQADILINRGKGIKVPASSSMFFEFMSDCTEFSFDYKILPGSAQNYYGIDLLVNGVNTVNKFEETNTTEGTFYAKIKEQGKKRITVYFPSFAKMEIKNLTVDGSIEKVQRKLKYLAFGDSITQGFFTGHPSLTYVNIVAQKLDACVLNQGIDGDVFRKEHIDADINFLPDLITVAYGTNDWAQEFDVYSGAKAFFETLKETYADTPIYALVPIHRNSIDGILKRGLTLEEVRKDIEKAAEENNITVIDARNFVPHHEDFYCDKRLHPNETGFVFYGHNLYEALKKELKK